MAAKLEAKKAGARIPERGLPARTDAVRTDSSERPTGPPRLALAGNKPTWRERQAQKEAEAAAGGAPPAAPPSDIATAEAQLPKKTGYVPPARRGDAVPRGRTDGDPSSTRDESSGGDAPAKWRPSTRNNNDVGRDGSPADRPTSRFADLRRKPDGPDGAAPSPRDGSIPAGTDSPAEGRPAPGKYVPVHLRNK